MTLIFIFKVPYQECSSPISHLLSEASSVLSNKLLDDVLFTSVMLQIDYCVWGGNVLLDDYYPVSGFVFHRRMKCASG